jgi:hypothetical protein
VPGGYRPGRDNEAVTTVDQPVTVTFAGSGDAFGSRGRYQACIHLRAAGLPGPVLLDCGATSLSAYTGDTAWTGALTEAAADADLLIAEAYYRDKNIPYHLRHADLAAHRDELTARRVILTHMSADVLDHQDQLAFEPAHDGLSISL